MAAFMNKLKALVGVDDEYYEEEYEAEEPVITRSGRSPRAEHAAQLSRDSIWDARSREREERKAEAEEQFANVTMMPGAMKLRELTTRFNIMVIEPKGFDECASLVDSLKARKPVIVNLETIQTETARKIFDFLSGATYALGGDMQKIANNIFVFLPENVGVSTGGEAEKTNTGLFGKQGNPWKL
jgi:cell division inhibitor SepF